MSFPHSAIAFVASAVVFVAACETPNTETQSVQTRADSLAQAGLIVDGHVDLPYRLNRFYEDPADSTVGGDFDYPRARAGGLDAPFMSIYVSADLQNQEGAAKERAETLIDIVENMVDEHADKFEVATSPEEVRQIARTDRIALPMGMENGAGLEGEMENVEYFYDRGIRYITLAHSEDNKIGDSSYAQDYSNDGLTDFGENVVREMNRLGMMVDISHVTDQTAHDVLDVTQAPVIASHSSARHFTPDWERNISDELIERVAETGGIVMVSFGSVFLRPEYRKRDSENRDEVSEKMDEEDLSRDAREGAAFYNEQRKANPVGTVSDVADHIDHVVDLVGIDHVGLGSDFDGVFSLPKGLSDASDLPNLIAELLDRGYAEVEIEKILGGNVLRVWSEVEATANQLQDAS